MVFRAAICLYTVILWQWKYSSSSSNSVPPNIQQKLVELLLHNHTSKYTSKVAFSNFKWHIL